MNSVDFVELLSDIDYPHADKIKASEYEWLFELDGDAVEFMRWLCGNISRANLLSQRELRLYNKLRSEDVLCGAALTTALDWHRCQTVARQKSHGDSCFSRAERLKLLRQQLADAQSRRERLRRVEITLRQQYTVIGNRVDVSKRTTAAASQQSRQQLQQLQAAQLQLTEARRQLGSAAQQLTQRLLSRNSSNEQPESDNVDETSGHYQLLSARQLRKLVDAEAGVSDSLRAVGELVAPASLSPQYTALETKLAHVVQQLTCSLAACLQWQADCIGWQAAIRLATTCNPITTSVCVTTPLNTQLCRLSHEHHVNAIMQRLCNTSGCCVDVRGSLLSAAAARGRWHAAAIEMAQQQFARCLWLSAAVSEDCQRHLAAGGAIVDLQRHIQRHLAAVCRRRDALQLLQRRLQQQQHSQQSGLSLTSKSTSSGCISVWRSQRRQLEVRKLQLFLSPAVACHQLEQLVGRLESSRVPARLRQLSSGVQLLKQRLRKLVDQWNNDKRSLRSSRLWTLAVLAPERLPDVVREYERRCLRDIRVGNDAVS